MLPAAKLIGLLGRVKLIVSGVLVPLPSARRPTALLTVLAEIALLFPKKFPPLLLPMPIPPFAPMVMLPV